MMSIEPSLEVLHVGSSTVVDVTTISVGSVNVSVDEAVQELSSVTVTVYVPAESALTTLVDCPIAGFQAKSIVPVPPEVEAVISPSEEPLQLILAPLKSEEIIVKLIIVVDQ